MIHPLVLMVLGGSAPSTTIHFSPTDGTYDGTSLDVAVTVTVATKFRWNIDNGAWTTVNSTSGIVTVPLSFGGHTLYVDALDGLNNVLASADSSYLRGHDG